MRHFENEFHVSRKLFYDVGKLDLCSRHLFPKCCKHEQGLLMVINNTCKNNIVLENSMALGGWVDGAIKNELKMARFLKLIFLFALKSNFIRGQF